MLVKIVIIANQAQQYRLINKRKLCFNLRKSTFDLKKRRDDKLIKRI